MAQENETLNGSEAANSEPSRQGEVGQEQDNHLQTENAEADQAEGEEDQDENDDGGEDDEKKRRPSRSERQARQIQRLRTEIDELKSVKAGSAVQDDASIAAAAKAKVGEPPKEADFKDWFDYRDAKSAYDAKVGVVEMQLKDEAGRAQGAERGRIQGLLEDYDDHLQAAGKANPELLKALKASTFEPKPALAMIVLEAGENAPLIAYHLTKNPREAERINNLSPIAAAREIGRIEALVSAPSKKATGAPKPVSGGLKGGSSPNRGPGQSMEDYERWRNSK